MCWRIQQLNVRIPKYIWPNATSSDQSYVLQLHMDLEVCSGMCNEESQFFVNDNDSGSIDTYFTGSQYMVCACYLYPWNISTACVTSLLREMTENGNALIPSNGFITACVDWRDPAISWNGARVNINYRKCGRQVCTIQQKWNQDGMVVLEMW